MTQPAVTLYQGDCLEFLRTLEPGSVDAVVTDPPYGVDLQYGSCSDTFDEWKRLVSRFIPEAVRISRGPVVVPTSKLEGEAYLHQLNPVWRICWFKGASCTRSPIGFKDWEPQFVFGSSPSGQVHDYFHASASSVRNQILGHPCPKPMAWALWMVRKMSCEGDTILDPFMGSGTTGVACVRTGRNFIGCEIDTAYFEIARKRIEAEQAKTALFDRAEPPVIQQGASALT